MKNIFIILIILLSSVSSYGSLNVLKINVSSLTKNSIQTLDFSGSKKTTVVIFLSKDCPCSKANLDYLNELARNYKEFTFVGVHSKKGSKLEEINAYLQDKKLNFDVLNDSDLKIADQFKALKTPHVFVVNTKGEIIYNGGVTDTTFPGNAKDHFLKTTLNEIQSNQIITHPETRTLGCFIAR